MLIKAHNFNLYIMSKKDQNINDIITIAFMCIPIIGAINFFISNL